jgi:hypothetical protein
VLDHLEHIHDCSWVDVEDRRGDDDHDL